MSHRQDYNPIAQEAARISHMMDNGYVEEAANALRRDLHQLQRYPDAQWQLVDMIQAQEYRGVGADIATRELYSDGRIRADQIALIMRPQYRDPWDNRPFPRPDRPWDNNDPWNQGPWNQRHDQWNQRPDQWSQRPDQWQDQWHRRPDRGRHQRPIVIPVGVIQSYDHGWNNQWPPYDPRPQPWPPRNQPWPYR